MNTRCKLAGMLTPAQGELLKALYELHSQLGPDRLWKPKDLGAFRSSHHALTLRRLQERGLVDRAPVGDSTIKPSFGYRITEDGIAAWALFKDMAALPTHVLLGGPGLVQQVNTMALMVQ